MVWTCANCIALELGSHPKPTQIVDALVTDGLAVEVEGDLVQKRQVSSVMVERSNSILVWLFFGFSQSLPQDF